MFRHTRNKLKNLIKKAKRSFMITALSSKRPREVRRTIHRILHPSQQPLRADPDDLNRHFASTAELVFVSSPVLKKDIYRLINRLTDDSHSPFSFCHVTHQEVLTEICDRTARLDQITYQVSLSNWWPRIWPLLSRISSTHALTEMNMAPVVENCAH